jgi:hypothetical protein
MAHAQVWIGLQAGLHWIARSLSVILFQCAINLCGRLRVAAPTTKPPIWAVLWPSVPLEHFSGGTPCSNHRWFTVRVAGSSEQIAVWSVCMLRRAVLQVGNP